MDNHTFALCLTHDVDRIYQTYQPLYYGLRLGDLDRLLDFFSDKNPYWQFEEIMSLEDELGVRSSFYFLNEQNLFDDRPVRDFLDPQAWKLFAGRYDIHDPDVSDIIRKLDERGWEVGLHASYESFNDPDRLRMEKETLESLLGRDIAGVRQHYLNLKTPKTWEYHREIGLHYDSSLGSSETFGFTDGYGPIYPFDDEFVVFPLTLMEVTVMRDRDQDAARELCVDLLTEARNNGAVMTVLWHPRFFAEDIYPGYRDLYAELIEKALDMGAWVGPCNSCYEEVIAK
jgi:peptidoglycan/xylan/chitin deacetylase (PgdA/CDA1 family)